MLKMGDGDGPAHSRRPPSPRSSRDLTDDNVTGSEDDNAGGTPQRVGQMTLRDNSEVSFSSRRVSFLCDWRGVIWKRQSHDRLIGPGVVKFKSVGAITFSATKSNLRGIRALR